MDGDNRQYIFDSTTDAMYSMTYFYKDGTWSLYDSATDYAEISRLNSQKVQKIQTILQENGFIPGTAKLSYDENENLRWDATHIDIGNSKKDFIDGSIMIAHSASGDLQSIFYGITDNRYVRDIEIISPREAFEKIQKGNFYSYNSYVSGDSIEITNLELSYMYDSKGYYQPVYKFTGSVNGEQDLFHAVIAASK